MSRTISTKDIVYIALFTALMAALGLIPKLAVGAVPITAQSLGVMLAGGVLGARRGAFAMALFLVLVMAGLPLLAGGRGGIHLLATPSGGFLLGFVAAAYVIGYFVERFWARLNYVAALGFCVIGGIAALYAVALPWWALTASVSLKAAAVSSVVFLPGDLIKATVAAAIIMQAKRNYPLI